MMSSTFSEYAKYAGIAADTIKLFPDDSEEEYHLKKVETSIADLMVLMTFIPAIIDYLQEIIIACNTGRADLKFRPLHISSNYLSDSFI